jgi:tRNA pseudouridine13 synthase
VTTADAGLDGGADLPWAHGGPSLRARFKAEVEDFEVDELLGFEPTGAGEHVFLRIEKRGANTGWIAGRLARIAGVAPVAVGYAGLKDRHGVARQHFTVHLPRQAEPDWSPLAADGARVLMATRHRRKLPRGALAGNRFRIALRAVQGDAQAAQARLAAIAAGGVPNYYGEQRFGRAGGNVAAARAMFAGRRVERAQRSILLSAARSHLFNTLLALRVQDGSWQQALEGDVFQLDGRGSVFGPEPIDEVLRQRVAIGEIHPTGPLWGTGPLRSTASVADREAAVAGAEPELAAGIVAAGMAQERRALRLRVKALVANWPSPDQLVLGFELPAGTYATVVLRELARLDQQPGVAGDR